MHVLRLLAYMQTGSRKFRPLFRFLADFQLKTARSASSPSDSGPLSLQS
jgi:hypothetical protein